MEKEEEVSKKIQERYALLQQIKTESENVQRKLLELEFARSELDKTIETLEFLDKLDNRPIEGLMNLGSGVYAYADVKNTGKVLINVGAGVIIEKNIKDAIEFAKKRVELIKDAMVRFEGALQRLLEEAEKVQNEINELAKQIKK